MHRYLPAPTESAVHFYFLTIHFYAVSILLGILVALTLTKRRFAESSRDSEHIYEVAARIIPAGIIGGRMYHVITSPDAYFGKNGHPLNVFKIWEGGMGIWGAVALGALVAYRYFQRAGKRELFPVFADALVPGLLLAQAIGRWGNWFNNELFGSPSTLPWALKVPLEFRPTGFEIYSTFHPTFLYESLWCAFGAVMVLQISAFSRLKAGSLFLAYIIYYCIGRFVFESIRIDPAHHILGLRVNMWISFIGLSVATYFLLRREKSPR